MFLKLLEFLPLFLTVSEEFYNDCFCIPSLGEAQYLHPSALILIRPFVHFWGKHWFSPSMLLPVFLLPVPMAFQTCGLSFQANLCLYIVFLASEFVGWAASASVSALNATLAVSLSCLGAVPLCLVPFSDCGTSESHLLLISLLRLLFCSES